MVGIGLTAMQFAPDLIAQHVGRQRPGAAHGRTLCFREDGRHQHGARVAIELHVVEVERMRAGAVDQSCRTGAAAQRGVQQCCTGAGVMPRAALQHIGDRLDRAGDHHADEVDKGLAGEGERSQRR